METDIALRLELATLWSELDRAKRRSNIAIGFSSVAFIVADIYWLHAPLELGNGTSTPTASVQNAVSPKRNVAVGTLTIRE